MVESLRIFGLLLYKNWLVRKRRYCATLIGEILIPVGIVLGTWVATSSFTTSPEEVKIDSHYKAYSLEDLIDLATNDSNGKKQIFYAPNNPFTNELMDNVNECFKYKANITGFTMEKELVAFYYGNKIDNGVAVIFDESVDENVKHLKYKLRSRSEIVSLYNDKGNAINMTEHYTLGDNLAQTQICLERSFVGMKSGNKSIPKMFIQQMPYPPHTKQIPFKDAHRQLFYTVMISAFSYPLLFGTMRAANEKFAGVNIVMSLNGISNTLNLFSWLVSGFLLISIFCGIPILMLLIHSPGYGLPFMHYGNPLLLYFILIFYSAHLLAFGIHVSAYFSKDWIVTTAMMLLHFLTMHLRTYAFTESTLFLAPYVGIIFPNILFYQAMEEIQIYENKVEGIHWYNLFTNTNAAAMVGSSVGMALILFVIGTVFHFLLAIYVYATNPRKYSEAKHPLYFLRSKNKEIDRDNMECLKYIGINKYFESTPAGAYVPEIQIRNLTKAYTINVFTNQKVEVLRDVSVDFYKNEITSLLGHNAAGKTTLMSILIGVVNLTEGTILIDSKDLKGKIPEIMKDVGVCMQDNLYFSMLTVREQLLFLATIKRKYKSKSSAEENVKALLQKLKLFDKKDALPDKLSDGQKRRLCLALALVGDPSTLILDEPTSGLDPESRHVIWNILLKMRGQKTILISTHDVKEANILGDRIAIMHSGQLKSYGTPYFLKRLIGQNDVEVVCSLEPQNDPERIRKVLHEDGIITRRETNKIIVNIPDSPELPDTLDNFEKNKKELGVSGFNVSFINLERVFLKMTQENDDQSNLHQTNVKQGAKLTGTTLFVQTVRALLSKKLSHWLKDRSAMKLKFFTVFIAVVGHALVLKGLTDATQFGEKLVHINLNAYPEPEVLYSSYDKILGDRFKSVSQNLGGNPIEVTDSNLESALLRSAKDNLVHYDHYLIAAAEFNESFVNAFYSNKATFSLPLSINLLWNTIIQNTLGPDYSITMSSQEMSYRPDAYPDMSESIGFAVSLSFAVKYCTTFAFFIMHPIREKARGVKQLQKMTGVSGLTYWATMFVFDFIEYASLVVFVVLSLACMDWSFGLRLYGPTEISIEVLLLVLFGISMLPLIYIFSFIKKRTITVMRMAKYMPIVIVMVNLLMSVIKKTFIDNDVVGIIRLIQKGIFMLIPYVSFVHSQISFFVKVNTNGRCHRLPNDFYDSRCKDPSFKDICCGFDCYDGKCENPQQFFADGDEDISLIESLIYLCVTPILYFGILAVIESQFVTKFKNRHAKRDALESHTDEKVQPEKSMIFERIRTLSGDKLSSINNDTLTYGRTQNTEDSDNRIFLAYELQKSYESVKAVKDLSFAVNRGECFALLGDNGSGKTTAFRMMTGGEIPDHGTMYMRDKDFENNEKFCLSQMGYCPQNNAILDSLNAYDHLRLFARLRGIPKHQLENEVQAWIERLSLSSCAAKPSGTYSCGNKRRLNIAIALIGNPSLVLMDEPTTGVDPGARRSIWNVIKSCQAAGQTVVLASHSMEECEALCDRLAIMVDGKLTCIGTSEKLKQRFGAGYTIKIRLDSEKTTDQVDSIKSNVAQSLNCVLVDENLGYLTYHVVPTGTTWREMYDMMNEMKKKFNCIDDFSIHSSTLEQLFLLFTRNASSESSEKSID